MKKAILIVIAAALAFVLAACGKTQANYPAPSFSDVEPTADVIEEPSANAEEASQEDVQENTQEETTMTLTVDGNTYTVHLEDNVTAKEIQDKLPLELSLGRYAGHEYYAELPFTPAFASETTSQIKAGHVYYWDGWNAFVINFIDYDIAPYKVVHIGEITDVAISEYLNQASDTVQVTVNK